MNGDEVELLVDGFKSHKLTGNALEHFCRDIFMTILTCCPSYWLKKIHCLENLGLIMHSFFTIGLIRFFMLSLFYFVRF